jgi:hypothetical protein
MALPSTTVLGTLALGTVGAVLAAGAALSLGGVVNSSNDDPFVPASPSPSALPCPAGTEDEGDECVETVVLNVPASPADIDSSPAASLVVSDDATPEPSESPDDDGERHDGEGEDGDRHGGEGEDGRHGDDLDDDEDEDADEDEDEDDDLDDDEDEDDDLDEDEDDD